MSFRLPAFIISKANRFLQLHIVFNKNQPGVPKGHMTVYVGVDSKKRFVIPLSYLNQPLLQGLLSRVVEEYEINHPVGGLTIPSKEIRFNDLAYQLDQEPVSYCSN